MKSVSLMLCSLLFLQSVAAREYVTGVEDLAYSPIYTTRHGRYEGYARDLLDSFYTFSYRALPIKRLYADFFPGNSILNTRITRNGLRRNAVIKRCITAM